LFRRPALDGDNWWRGHAAAFLRFVNIPPKALLRGRVCQVIPWLLLLRIMNMNFGDSVVISISYI
jgi:hypothetical protein